MMAKAINKYSEKGGNFLLQLYRKALQLSGNELYEYFLDHAVYITKSTIGFFHFVSSDQDSIILTAWNEEALKNCDANYSVHYPIEQAGNWADCVRLKRPVIYNNFARSPNQKGLPEGHVSIKRLLSIPVMDGDRVLAIFGVGNKVNSYIKSDVDKLELVANELSKIVNQRRVESELRESNENYRSLFSNMLDGFAYCKMVFDEKGTAVDFIYLEVNDAFERLTGLRKEAVVGKSATEAIPGIKEGNPELFDIYGRVAIYGKQDKFEVFFKPLGIWFNISVYSPKRGYFAAVFENITERRKAEESLRESEERLIRSQEIAHLGSWELDLLQNKLTWSDEVYKMFGLKPQEFGATYEAFLAIVHPDDRKAVDDAYSASVRECKDGYEIEHRVVRNDDASVRFVHEKCNHVRDETGKIVKSLGMVHDITERRKAEAELVESEKKYRRLYETSQDGIIARDLEGHLIDCNQAYSKMIGYSREELSGLSWQQILPEKWHEQRKRAVNEIIEKGGSIVFEREYERKDGSVFPASVRTWRLADEKGRIIGTWSVVRDITEIKNTEEALRQAQAKLQNYTSNLEKLVEERAQKIKESEQDYRELYESFGEAFIATDWEFNIIHWNKVAEMVTGVSASEALGKKVYDVLPEMTTVDITPYFEALRQKKNVRFMMNTVSRETNRPSVFEVSVYPSARGMIIIVEDKTDEEETKRLSFIGQTAGMVGHDIRNPLQSILADVYLLKSELRSLPQWEANGGIKESLDGIQENIGYINKIVADLQDYARPIVPSSKRIDVETIFGNVLANQSIPDNIKVSYEVEAGAKELIADPDLLKRIFTNLVNNAVQAMPGGGKLVIHAYKKENEVELAVGDTGLGIPDDVKPKLFAPLFTTKSKGQGFGLAVVKRLTEALGGRVTFESEVGKGTVFLVSLPLKK
jgi:PAS domain S-box-containing protein